jgi:hypothetical protein
VGRLLTADAVVAKVGFMVAGIVGLERAEIGGLLRYE